MTARKSANRPTSRSIGDNARLPTRCRVTPPVPDLEQIEEWMDEGGCEATDGCWVEPDGTCEHGCESWAIVLGLI